jgi:signal transduction histidine kinase
MKSASVRTKLTLWNVGVLALALCLLGLGISYGARKSLLASVDRDMTSRAQRQVQRVAQYLTDFPRGEPSIKILGVSSGSPKLLIPGIKEPVPTFQVGSGEYAPIRTPQPPPSSDPGRSPFRTRILHLNGRSTGMEPPYDLLTFNQAKGGATAFSEITIENEPARLVSMPVYVQGKIARVVQYPQPLAGTYAALGGITWTLVTVLPLILIFATAGGAFLAGRALKPVREITDTASEIGAENLSGRLDVKGNDEFSRLAGTFNGMLERLQGAFTGMERAVEQQRRFTADASHELRTPLTVIKANTSLALRGTRSVEEYQKSLAAVNAAADSMNRLVNDLLILARSDNGKLEVNCEPTCLRPLLKEAVSSVVRPGVAEIKLEMADEGLEVLGDGHSILRIFVNLLENAARHTPPEGSIELRQKRDGDWAVIEVADTGAGIAPEHLPHLTERFYRVDEARARAEGGNGLGLSICSSIVEAHAGTMSIDSEVGKGTTVTVRLPVA